MATKWLESGAALQLVWMGFAPEQPPERLATLGRCARRIVLSPLPHSPPPEYLRHAGASALSRFSAVIVDEVHERSVESDLAHAMLRLLVCRGGARRTARCRLVLMSATFDAARYEAFFRPASCPAFPCTRRKS